MRLTITFLLAAWIAGTGCSRPGANEATTSSELKQAVQTKLASDPLLSQIQVTADASHNQVILSGPVADEDARREAMDLAKSVNATPTVVDNMDVTAPETALAPGDTAEHAREKAKALGDKIGASLDDAWVYTRIEAKLVQHAAAPALKINVDVENNVVTLRGQVRTVAMKEEAERIARETEGVKAVYNLLQVRA